jgi:molybdopterin synthase catalytic subunit
MISIRIQTADFDASTENAVLHSFSAHIGAVVEFTGYVRALESNTAHLTAINLEHYPGMTEKSIRKIVDEALLRWPVMAITIIHRVGTLTIGERIVYVGVASSHRRDALQCVDFIMDYLKNDVPVWKQEVTETSARWVGQKETDILAKSAWTLSK